MMIAQPLSATTVLFDLILPLYAKFPRSPGHHRPDYLPPYHLEHLPLGSRHLSAELLRWPRSERPSRPLRHQHLLYCAPRARGATGASSEAAYARRVRPPRDPRSSPRQPPPRRPWPSCAPLSRLSRPPLLPHAPGPCGGGWRTTWAAVRCRLPSTSGAWIPVGRCRRLLSGRQWSWPWMDS